MKMQRLRHKVQPILDEVFDNGQGTRMEIFNRSDNITNWEVFKRHIGFLRAQGMLETVPFEQRMKGREAKNTKQLVIDLTEEGHEFVHSLRQ